VESLATIAGRRRKLEEPSDNEIESAPLSTVLDEAGLKLESQEVSIPVLVIDHVEKPAFN
jgi:uncharacterized protein (TIGR03435 family)